MLSTRPGLSRAPRLLAGLHMANLDRNKERSLLRHSSAIFCHWKRYMQGYTVHVVCAWTSRYSRYEPGRHRSSWPFQAIDHPTTSVRRYAVGNEGSSPGLPTYFLPLPNARVASERLPEGEHDAVCNAPVRRPKILTCMRPMQGTGAFNSLLEPLNVLERIFLGFFFIGL